MLIEATKDESYRQEERVKKRGICMKHNLIDRTDWERLRNMTEEELEAAVASDPDTFFLTEEEMKGFRRVHPVEVINVKSVRENIKMTQEQFADYFGVKVRTIQEWEQHRRTPSATARNFLKVIWRFPKIVREALTT